MALGDEFFVAKKASGRRFAMDGRQFVRHASDRWDVLHVDAYAHQVYVPAHLASVEFFADAYARLTDGGVIACNVGALSFEDPVLRAVMGTVAAVFEDVAVLMVPRSRNALVLGRRGASLDPEALDVAHRGGALTASDQEAWSGILNYAADPARWQRLEGAGPVLCDDRPVLDELLLESYVRSSDPACAVAPQGARALVDAEQAAFEANQRGDWSGALGALAQSRGASAFLRLQAGDARWNLRHLRSADLEYRAGMVDADAELRATLEQRLEGLQSELAPILAAESSARWLGWLCALVVAAGLGAALAIRRC